MGLVIVISELLRVTPWPSVVVCNLLVCLLDFSMSMIVYDNTE